MNKLEVEMIALLKDLKVNHDILGVKSEFEAEGASIEEILYLKNIISDLDLELTLKIGGCEAITDLINAKLLNANKIVAPMIETPFALKKFTKAIKNNFSEKERLNFKFYINIESITGFNNSDEIIKSPDFEIINGITFGRSDMVESLNFTKDKVESTEIFNYAKAISSKINNKTFIIGGNISVNSIYFLKNLPNLSHFETRKIIFNQPKTKTDNEIINGIKKALQFELLWLKNKQKLNLNFTKENLNRINTLETKIQEFIYH